MQAMVHPQRGMHSHSSVMFWLTFLVLGLGALRPAGAQLTLDGTPAASFCDRVYITNRFQNSGTVASGLIITNQLPNNGYVYVTNLSVVTVPGQVWTNAAAEPAIVNGTNLIWSFTNLVGTGAVSHVLITEVFYYPTNSPTNSQQWVELFNPTTNTIGMTNWSLRDNRPGQIDVLPTIDLAPNEFIIIAASTNAFFETHTSYTGRVFEVADGIIGNGLAILGDGLDLRNGATQNVDQMSYGLSTTAFNPSCPTVAAGHSLERYPANQDTVPASTNDWRDQGTPNPGTGTLQYGLGGGELVQIVYAVEISCGVNNAPIVARAYYEQPPGTPRSASATHTVTIEEGALVISKTPVLQSAGYLDLVAWNLTVSNQGFGKAVNVRITDDLGPGLKFYGFSVNPTNGGSSNVWPVQGGQVAWDASVIPALTSLAPDTAISLVVTAEMVACTGLYNRADATWGCRDLLAVSNQTCADTASEGQTAGASLFALDRHPDIHASLSPASPILVDYCAGTQLTFMVTNVFGTNVGWATKCTYMPNLPAGWRVSPTNGSGEIVIGDLAPGQGTNVVVTLSLAAGGPCPVAMNDQAIYFLAYYEDGCEHPFATPPLFGMARVINPPGASVTKQMAREVSGDARTNPVAIFYAYSNFSGTAITLRDSYPAHTNLYATNINASGLLNTNTATVTWTNTLSGSGVFTARYDLVIRTPCGGPSGLQTTTLTASNFSDCVGCEGAVSGNGQAYYLHVIPGSGCYTNGGGTGGCHFASSKTGPGGAVEVCGPGSLSHTFYGFTGTNLQTNWNGIIFNSDLAGQQGYLYSTQSVAVYINNSNVTTRISITQTNPNLVIALSNLNASPFFKPSLVTNSLIVVWEVAITGTAQVADGSYLSMPVSGCGVATEYAFWNGGRGELAIALTPFQFAEACGLIPLRIDLTNLPSPGTPGLSNSVFPSYDTRVVLNLDADGDGAASFGYVTNSTAFSNMVALSGGSPTGVVPVVTATNITWTLGDLATNGAGSIYFRLRASCDSITNEKHSAKAEYNSLCARGLSPPDGAARSGTNPVAMLFDAALYSQIKPEVVFINSSNLSFTVSFLNSGAATAFNIRPELLLPSNLVYQGAAVTAAVVTASNVIWTFQLTNAVGGLTNADDDIYYDDLPPGAKVEFAVTCTVVNCDNSGFSLRATHGCNGQSCQTSPVVLGAFEGISGGLVTRTEFPDTGAVCQVSTVEIRVRNSGQTMDYNVRVFQTLPADITYVAGSSCYSNNGVVTSNSPDAITPRLIWSASNVPPFAALSNADTVILRYQVYIGAQAALNPANTFIAQGEYRDTCFNLVTNREATTMMLPKDPLLNLTKSARLTYGPQTNFTNATVAANLNDILVYKLTVAHDLSSAAPVYAMELRDTLPSAFHYLGASTTPDSTNGNILVWSNATMMVLAGGSPYAVTSAAFSIYVTGTVVACASSAENVADLSYGCNSESLVIPDQATHILRSTPDIRFPIGELALYPCAGSIRLGVTNQGSTASGLILTNTAPSGYVFSNSVSITGAFNSAGARLTLGGSPSGSVAVLDLSSTNICGPLNDPLGAPITNPALNYKDGFVLGFGLINSGSNLDFTAHPLDRDYEDPDPPPRNILAAACQVRYQDSCGTNNSAATSLTDLPDEPDPDIDLQPNSLVPTNNQTVTFTCSVRNRGDSGDAANLHVRLRFGSSWTNLALVSNNIVAHGVTNLDVEIQGSSNVLVDMPLLTLDPQLDRLDLYFSAQATTNGNQDMRVLAEVVGECLESSIIPTQAFTNTLGEAPLVSLMSGTNIFAITNGVYYAFDQDMTFGAGFNLLKTVRYQGETNTAAGFSRTARIGEELVYRIEAQYFGAVFSNIVVYETLPTNLVWRAPVDAGSSDALTNWTYSAVSNKFTLPTPLATSAVFKVDISAFVSNSLANQNGVVVTNAASSTFTVFGVTNTLPPATAMVYVVEPDLRVTKQVSSNSAQAGSTVIYSNLIQHVAGTATTAYDVVFYDTLPAGLTLVDLGSDELDNDGNGVADGADAAAEAALAVSPTVFQVSSNKNAALGAMATGATVAVMYKAQVEVGAIAGSTVTNQAYITYASLAGADCTNGNIRTGAVASALNDYYRTSAVPLNITAVQAVSKTFVSSSQTNTPFAPTNVFTIGERVVYNIRVDIPNGTISNLYLTDLMPSGMDWVGPNTNAGLAFPGTGFSITVPTNAISLPFTTNQGLVITDPDPTPDNSVTNDAGMGGNIVFRFPSITNQPDGVATNDYFTLALELVVANTNVNVGYYPGITTNANRAVVSNAYVTMGATSQLYTIAEPRVTLTKQLAPTNFDAGTIVTVAVVIANSTNARANAYDLQISDFLTNRVFDTGSVALVETAAGWGASNAAGAGGLTLYWFTTNGTPLPPGAAATNRFSVVIAQTVEPGRRYTNSAILLRSDTLYDPPPGGIPERWQTATNSATGQVPAIAIAKALYATGETNTPPDSATNNLQIGETVTYALSVTLPEATITNLAVVDLLPAGLAYIHNSVRLDTNGLGGWLAPLSVAPTGTTLLATNGVPVTNLFAGLSVISGDNDTNNNSFTIYLDAITLNTNANLGTNAAARTVLTNRASATYTGNPLAASTSAPVLAQVAEPKVALTKTLSPKTGDAGDPITVTLLLTNSGLAAAYRLDLSDPLAAPRFDPAGVTATVAPTGFVFVLSNSTVYIRSDTNAPLGTNTLEPGESLLFSFQAPLATNLSPALTLTNTAVVTWASLKATNIYDVQRTGSATGLDTLVSSNFLLVKALAGTSQQHYPADTSGSNVTIGEYAAFRLSVSLPEGVITNLAVTDTMPTGMAYIVSSVSVDTNGFAGALPGAPAVSGGGNGMPVTFTFSGLTVLTNDNIGTNNTFHISLNAMLLDVTNNIGFAPGQTILTNRATVGYGGQPHTATSGVVVLTVVEPNLAITKQMTGPSNGVVTLALTVTNSGQASAFDLHISDVIPSNIFQTATITNISIPTGFVYTASGAPGDATVTLASDTNTLAPTNCVLAGQSLAFTFSALLVSNPPPVFTNIATILTNTTIDGPSPDERKEPQRAATNVLALPGFLFTKALTTPTNSRPVNIGETVVFRLAVTNTGSLGLSPVRLDDTWNTNYLTYVSAVPAPSTTGASSLVWTNVGLLATNRATNVVVTFTARASTSNGWTTNTAAAAVTATNGATLPPQTNSAALQIIRPSINLVKLAGDATNGGVKYVVSSQAVTFTYIFTNTGDTTLTNVTVTDNKLGTVGIFTNRLAPGAAGTLTITTNIPASVTNIGTVTGLPATTNGTPLGAPAVTDTNDAIVQVVGPAIRLVKTAGGATNGAIKYAAPGSNVLYTYSVVNIGNTYLTNMVVTDNVLGVIGTIPGPAAPNSTNVLYATNLNVTLNVTNLGVVVGTPSFTNGPIPGITNVSDTNDAVVQVVSPAIQLVKTAGEAANGDVKYATPGSNVVYTYRVVNIGNTYLTNIVVTDNVLTGWTGTVFGVIAPGATSVFYATNLNVIANVTNLGTVNARPAFSNGAPIPEITTNVNAQDNAIVEVVNPRVQLVKTADDAAEGAVKPVLTGSNVAYAYRVVNLGATWLTNLVVTDNVLGVIGTIPGPAAPNSTNWIYATNLNVTANVTNLGTVTALPAFTNGLPIPGVPPVTDTNDAVVRVVWPGYSLAKTAISPTNRPAIPGETLTFRVVAANTGDVPFAALPMEDRFDTNDLAFVSATPAHDTLTNGLVAWTNVGALGVGASTNILVRFTALRSITEWHTNTVAVLPVPPAGFPPVPGATSDAPYLIDAPAAVGDYVWDDINLNGIQDPGETGLVGVAVTLYATNAVTVIATTTTDGTGHYLFTNVVPTNYLVGFTLLPGYAFTPPHMGSGTNDSDANQTNGLTPVFSLAPGTTNLAVDAGMSDDWPRIKLVKTADSAPEGGIDYVPSGANVLYTYRITNTGTTYLVHITNTDNRLGVIGPITNVLAPGASLTVTALRTNVTASVTNIAVVSADPADMYGAVMPGVPDTGDTNDAIVWVATPDYTLNKQLLSPTNRPALTNETVAFLISVTNTGHLPLHRLRLDDRYDTNIFSFASAVPSNDALDSVAGQITWSNLGPVYVGGVTTVVASFTALAPTWPLDTTNTVVSVAGLTNGTPADYPRTGAAPAVVVAPGYRIEKTLLIPTNGLTPVGQPAVFRITVTNTGDTLLDMVRLDDRYPPAHLAFVSAHPSNTSLDAIAGRIAWSNIGPLAVGGSLAVTTEFTAVSGTLPGATTNYAVVSPSTTNGLPLAPSTSQAPVSVGTSGLRLVKLAGSAPEGGVEYVVTNATVTYAFIVTNTGNTYLNNIAVTDNKLGLIGTLTNPLAPAAATTLYASVAIPAAVTNVAVAAGQPSDVGGLPLPGFLPVADTNDAIVRLAWPGLRLIKLAGSAPEGGVEYVATNATVTYAFIVTNTGNTYLNNIAVTDNKLGLIGTLTNPLAPAAATTLYASVAIPAAVTNVAVAAGQPSDAGGLPLPGFLPVADTNDAIVRLAWPGISLVKTAGDAKDGEVLYAFAGQDVVYHYRIVNTGSTWLGPITLNDDKLGLIGTIAGPLAPGAEITLHATNRNVLADVLNVATVSGNPTDETGRDLPVFPEVTATDQAEVRLSASFVVAKEDFPDPVRPGEALSYTLWIANPSPNPIYNVVATETFPAAFEFIGARPQPTAGNNVWSLGTLPPGKVLAIVIYGRIAPGAAPGTVTNRAVVSSSNAGTNTVLEPTIIIPPPDPETAEISVTKRDLADPVRPGSNLVYVIHVENAGPAAAANLVVRETYDPLFLFRSAEPAPDAGSVNTWSLGALAAGSSVEITISGQVSTQATAGTLLVNRVTAAAANSPTSTDTEITIVEPYPQLTVSKADSSDPILAGVSFSYTLRITNTSASAAVSNVMVTDHYDPAFVFESSTPAPLAGTENVWRFDALAPGATASIVITGHTTTNLEDGHVIFNTVEVVSDSGSDTAHEPTVVRLPASLGDTFWEDFNLNNVYDDPVSDHVVGRRVGLFSESGALIAVTNVDAQGHYRFTRLWPGVYAVGFDLPPLHRFVMPNVGTNPAIDSDVDRATWRTPPITLGPGQNDMTWDAGCIEVGIIGDFVWVDVNRNGLHDENLAIWGLNGIPVHLYRVEKDTPVYLRSTVTSYGSGADKGHYEFAYLDYGLYRVVVDIASVPSRYNERTTPITYDRQIDYDTAFYDCDVGVIFPPTAIVLRYFNARALPGGVRLSWETAAEVRNLGFNIYRSERLDGARTQSNPELIPGLGTAEGQRYQWTDRPAPARKYFYWLEDVSWDFATQLHGPARVQGVAEDYDGDGKADLVMFDEATGTWVVFLSASAYACVTGMLGGPGTVPVPADYDGDGKADPAVYRAADGSWTVMLSGRDYAVVSFPFGGPGLQATPADYDGDGRADPAVYRAADGAWSVMLSGQGYGVASLVLGEAGAVPVPADYDGDGCTDPAVYRAADGMWAFKRSLNAYALETLAFGGGCQPLPGDYDGDGRADPAVYRAADGAWSVMLSDRGYAAMTLIVGGPGAEPMPFDFDGDGKLDFAVYQPGPGRLSVKLSASNYAEISCAWQRAGYRFVR